MTGGREDEFFADALHERQADLRLEQLDLHRDRGRRDLEERAAAVTPPVSARRATTGADGGDGAHRWLSENLKMIKDNSTFLSRQIAPQSRPAAGGRAVAAKGAKPMILNAYSNGPGGRCRPQSPRRSASSPMRPPPWLPSPAAVRSRTRCRISSPITPTATQRRLDIIAEELVTERLRHAPVRFLASEEKESALSMLPGALVAVAIDPLDGSTNIDANAPLGMIFSLLPAWESSAATFRQTGRSQLAAGIFVLGPHTSLLLTLGEGVCLFTLDPTTQRFTLARTDVSIPANSREFAVNASNERFWSPRRAQLRAGNARGPTVRGF